MRTQSAGKPKSATGVAAGMLAVALPILLGIFGELQSQAQSQTTPKFEVVSIKPCKGGDSSGGPGASKGGGPLGNGGPPSAGRLTYNCATVVGLIQQAYVTYANGRRNLWPSVPIEAGPAWINSDRYEINAKAGDTTSPAMMQGPMLQALLEDRFKLKIHPETREVPVYVLTIAKGGPKLQPFREGSCTPVDFTKLSSPPAPRQKPGCNSMIGAKGPNMAQIYLQGATLDEFSKALGLVLGRPVINKTGISGLFELHPIYAVDQSIAGLPPTAIPTEPEGPSIFTAVQEQLGLKLDSARGPGERLIIDSVARPSEN